MAEPSTSHIQTTTTTTTTAATTTVTPPSSWGTQEELLLACAVQRHGIDAWDSVSRELHNRTSFSHFTPLVCQQKYRDLKRRFTSDVAEEVAGDDAGLWLEELRRLRVAELRRDLQRYDLSIVSLQLKVKKLKEERESNVKEEIKEEREKISDPKKTEERETEIHEVKIEPEPVEPDRVDEPVGGGEEDDSCNGSSNSKDERRSEKEKRERVDSGELVESVAESKDDGGGGGGVKESSDLQSTASLWRSEKNDDDDNNVNDNGKSGDENKRREKKIGVFSGTSSGEENQSPAVKASCEGKSCALVEFLDVVRARKLGSFFERRLESQKQEGIPPRMFKTVIAASHPEFSTTRQQDALEFFLHLLEQVERVNAGNPKLDPSRNFKFGIEDRIQCPSGKVTYNRRSDYILSLNIPLHEATNKDQLEAFQKLKSQAESEGKEMAAGEVVRPRVPLEACLASYSAPEEVMDFFSTALKAKTTATKTTGLTSFPDYLVLHMRKFVMEDGWVPKKLDVYIDVPDIIDISHMRSNGLRPGEELLPESAGDAEAESTRLVADELIVSQLLSMGFGRLPCEKAAIFTNNAGVEEAMNWLLTHMDDSDINDPISHTSQNAAVYVDPSSVEVLISFGFQEELARKALTAMGGDIEKATDWIFNNPDASSTSDMDTSSSGAAAADAELPDGSGRYRLLGFVSHMGTSTHCGHYVAHIYKDGKWVLYNDEKVGASVNPPKDMGYLYFFERLAD